MQLACLAPGCHPRCPRKRRETPGTAILGLALIFPFLEDESESPGLEAVHVSIFLLFPSFIFFLIKRLIPPQRLQRIYRFKLLCFFF